MSEDQRRLVFHCLSKFKLRTSSEPRLCARGRWRAGYLFSRAHPDRLELPAELRDLLIRIRATAKGAEMATMAPASPRRQAGWHQDHRPHQRFLDLGLTLSIAL